MIYAEPKREKKEREIERKQECFLNRLW
uniref:Uncharacterized protein n=1 Tax=Arundo donax TaxID=35708 RepID=A0A0A8XRP6_ARUDO